MATRASLICFSTVFLVSSSLLFSFQPMVAKMLLPRFGGSSAVWTTCMLFFQVMLLAGYTYAHLLSTRLAFRTQVVVHLLVVVAAVVFLPVAPHMVAWNLGQPVFTLLLVLASAAGVPFFVVSTTAPLMQRWYAHAGQVNDKDPYFLYAISNTGSMLSLLAYPLVIERILGLELQTFLWTVGYGLLAILLVLSAVLVWRSPDALPMRTATRRSEAPLRWRQRMMWLALAFVPSSWMLAVTTRLTTNIAPMPLLWIIPLGIYLLTFILVFARRQLLPRTWIQYAFPAVMLVLLGSLMFYGRWELLALHTLAFFIGAMFCHGELAATRPHVEHLTEFYLWMSLGGALGGVFNAVVAPLLFPLQLEYGIVIACACVLYAFTVGELHRKTEFFVVSTAVLAIGVLVRTLAIDKSPSVVTVVVVAIPILLGLQLLKWRLLFALALLAVVTLVEFDPGPTYQMIARARSFYGVHQVVIDRARLNPQDGTPFPQYRRLLHGTTQHGCQSTVAARECEPLLYYHASGPLGDCFAALDSDGPRQQKIAAIGLGTGAMACYQTDRRQFTFFEIDSHVHRIATEHFTYLSTCGPGAEVIIGDGRLQIERLDDHCCTAIVLDAFSSDAVPTHLLTREALALYLQKLQPDGLLIFHVSNQYLDLPRVLSASALDAGLVARHRQDIASSAAELDARSQSGIAPASYVVMARAREHLRGIDRRPDWTPLAASEMRVWTDDYSNVFNVLKFAAEERISE